MLTRADAKRCVFSFAAAEPLLKGTQLADKIEELKRNVKRKYSTQVHTPTPKP